MLERIIQGLGFRRRTWVPTSEDIATYDRERSVAAHHKLTHFSERSGTTLQTFEVEGKRLVFVGSSTVEPVMLKTLVHSQDLIATALRNKGGTATRPCLQVAVFSMRSGLTQECARAWMKPIDFQEDVNHVVAIKNLPEGKVWSIDLTAATGIDRHQGRMDILVLEADTVAQLMDNLHQVYGGNWSLIPHEEVDQVEIF